MVEKRDKITKIFLDLNLLLCFVLVEILLSYFFKIFPAKNQLFIQIVAVVATLPVLFGALYSLKNKKISIDLLAGVALVVSLIEKEWISAIFINLMVASARSFIEYVKIRSHSAIDSLLKLKPKIVKIEKDGQINEIPLEDVKKKEKVHNQTGGPGSGDRK